MLMLVCAVRLAQVFSSRGQETEQMLVRAETLCSKALVLEPTHARALVRRAKVRFAQGRKRAALF